LCAAILDWAKPNNVGFSTVVSLGSSSDIDFGEVLEYMISDPRTESIFLYVEGIRDARRFMSALRGAARVKPVLLIKAGRHPNAQLALRRGPPRRPPPHERAARRRARQAGAADQGRPPPQRLARDPVAQRRAAR